MEPTIIKPAVIEPSQIPRIRRTAKRPAKLLQAAWLHKAMAQMNTFKLDTRHFSKWSSVKNVWTQPHPFSDGKPLQRQILRKLEGEISEIEDRS